jgi:uncharacterized membrane protein
MHFFGAPFILAPLLLGFGLLKVVLFVGLIVLLVRFATGHRYHHAYAPYSPYGHHAPYAHTADDPRRVAAMRYASGSISREEFDRILRDIDAASGTTTPQPPAAS